jgi:hypothetical protein
MVELIHAYETGSEKAAVAGIAYRQNNMKIKGDVDTVLTPARTLASNLDDIPSQRASYFPTNDISSTDSRNSGIARRR